MSDKASKESQYIVSRPGPGSDPLFGSDWESRRDIRLLRASCHRQSDLFGT